MDTLTRRSLIAGGLAALAAVFALLRRGRTPDDAAAAPTVPAAFEVQHTDDEWRRRLTPGQYDVLRREGTEYPFTSPLNAEHRAGRFACAGCGLELFSSSTKFDSGTGWPSFWQPIGDAVLERTDHSMLMSRTEVLCRRCGGHLGHVFNDGPPPTGLRYCINGIALTFEPGAA